MLACLATCVDNAAMPNIANALKAEIARVARKEIRAEVAALKKASSQHRSLIASMRREIESLRRELKGARRSQNAEPKNDSFDQARRFRASGFASHRQRLGLSAADMGKLLGVTGQSVYKWESGETRPRRAQLEAIAVVRKMGRREALAKLAA